MFGCWVLVGCADLISLWFAILGYLLYLVCSYVSGLVVSLQVAVGWVMWAWLLCYLLLGWLATAYGYWVVYVCLGFMWWFDWLMWVCALVGCSAAFCLYVCAGVVWCWCIYCGLLDFGDLLGVVGLGFLLFGCLVCFRLICCCSQLLRCVFAVD